MLLLFESTRSLFEGWIRGFVAAALAAFAVTMLLAIEVSLIAPWLAQLLALRQAGYPVGGAATELLVVAFAFALILVAGLGMGARVAVAFRFGRGRPVKEEALNSARAAEVLIPPSSVSRLVEARLAGAPSRAAATSEALAMAERREALAIGATASGGRAFAAVPDTHSGRVILPSRQHSRRTRTRISAASARRDVGR